MAEETTFEKPAPLDLGSPQGLRKWFHLSGRHYPEEREKEMLSEIPRLIEDSQSFSTQKERDDYSEYLRAKYTRDPISIPSRYRRENLSVRGVAADKIREMQSSATPTLKNFYRDVSSGKVPLSLEANLESMGSSVVPNTNEPLDKYQHNIMGPTSFTDIPSRIRKHTGALASTKHLNPSPFTEIIRSGAEDYLEAPVSTNDLAKKAGSLAGHAFTPPIALVNYTIPSAVYQGVKDLGSMGPMKRKRFSDAILKLTGQQPKDKWAGGSSGLDNYYDEDGTLLVRE